jgi:uncharacterized protein YlxP (DUF503 family)
MQAATWGSQDDQQQFHISSLSVAIVDIQLSEKLKRAARFIDLKVLYTCNLNF